MDVRDLDTMSKIQKEKQKEIDRDELKELDAEGRAMGEHKRFTFDVIDIPTDPLR